MVTMLVLNEIYKYRYLKYHLSHARSMPMDKAMNQAKKDLCIGVCRCYTQIQRILNKECLEKISIEL